MTRKSRMTRKAQAGYPSQGTCLAVLLNDRGGARR